MKLTFKIMPRNQCKALVDEMKAAGVEVTKTPEGYEARTPDGHLIFKAVPSRRNSFLGKPKSFDVSYAEGLFATNGGSLS